MQIIKSKRRLYGAGEHEKQSGSRFIRPRASGFPHSRAGFRRNGRFPPAGGSSPAHNRAGSHRIGRLPGPAGAGRAGPYILSPRSHLPLRSLCRKKPVYRRRFKNRGQKRDSALPRRNAGGGKICLGGSDIIKRRAARKAPGDGPFFQDSLPSAETVIIMIRVVGAL